MGEGNPFHGPITLALAATDAAPAITETGIGDTAKANPPAGFPRIGAAYHACAHSQLA